MRFSATTSSGSTSAVVEVIGFPMSCSPSMARAEAQRLYQLAETYPSGLEKACILREADYLANQGLSK